MDKHICTKCINIISKNLYMIYVIDNRVQIKQSPSAWLGWREPLAVCVGREICRVLRLWCHLITPKGYTKHYYAGAERIATVLGGGGFEDRKYPVVSLDKQHENDIINAFNLNYKHYDPFNHEKRLSDPLPTATTDGNTLPELDYMLSQNKYQNWY